MTDDIERSEYNQFRVDLLSSKFKGVHTERQMIERLLDLYARKNRYAVKALVDAKVVMGPDSRMSNSIWESGQIYNVIPIGFCEQPEGTEYSGLWKDQSKSR